MDCWDRLATQGLAKAIDIRDAVVMLLLSVVVGKGWNICEPRRREVAGGNEGYGTSGRLQADSGMHTVYKLWACICFTRQARVFLQVIGTSTGSLYSLEI